MVGAGEKQYSCGQYTVIKEAITNAYAEHSQRQSCNISQSLVKYGTNMVHLSL